MQRITTKKIKELQLLLLSWYKHHGRKFPWRKRSLSNYQVIIAEVLLQRTRAETVSIFYLNFVRDFPNWKTIAESTVSKLEKSLRPIGLYRQRARRLHRLAVEMVKRQGRLPRDRFELEKIPFLGQYISNAIELLIFNFHRPLLDVNMARLLERYFGQRKMADIRYDPYLQKLALNAVNHQKSKELNWAILDYASMICAARKPACYECLLSKKCIYCQSQYYKECANR